jgi:CHAT domain-containing protein
LYDVLIQPIESLLDDRKQVCIIPDKILSYLPYGALISPTSGKYLIEEHTLFFSPSCNTLIESSDSAHSKEGNVPERILSVGNPRLDRKAFPSLPDLRAARREAEAIAAYYDFARCLVEKNATKKNVENEMKQADVIHLALHGIVDEQDPGRSKLLLAKTVGGDSGTYSDDGALLAGEIHKLKLPRTRLVVLSACQTATGRYYGGEGLMGLSRPFVAARIPLVVASLWPVDSDATAELMIDFHKCRKVDKLSTVNALRRAQLALLSSGSRLRDPYYWASFIIVGGYAGF